MWYTATVVPPFRFGHQLRSGPIDDLVAEARAAEAAGFDVVTVPDHVGSGAPSPMVVLAAIARETTRIRLGTFVLNNEMRNPVQLAWEATTLDRVSGGRFELGLGAGHTPHEFAATGIELPSARARKARLAESAEIIRALLDGETVSRHGEQYSVDGATVEPPAQNRLPLMLAGNGHALLDHAGRVADIVGLNGLGRTLDDGHRHTVRFSPGRTDEQVATVITAAAGREHPPELNALVQVIEITDDRERAAARVVERVEGLALADALATPYLAFGTTDEIAGQFVAARARWALSYFVTRDIDAMAPIIARLRAHS